MARCAIRGACDAERAWLQCRGHRDAGAGHRRQHGHFQRRRRCTTYALPYRKFRSPRDLVQRGITKALSGPIGFSAPEFEGIRITSAKLRGHRRVWRPSGGLWADISRKASAPRGCLPRYSTCSAFRRLSAIPFIVKKMTLEYRSSSLRIAGATKVRRRSANPRAKHLP